MFQASFPLAFILLLCTACMKHKAEEKERIIPSAVIQFSSPVPGSVFRQGEVVQITAKAKSTEPIHGYDLAIKGVTDGKVYYFNHLHEHKDSLLVNHQWQNILNTTMALEAEITLYLDHEGHTYKSKTSFQTQ